MCTADVAQYILDALEARIKNQSVFTAKDVTDDARVLTDENVEHRDVRRIVHEEFNTGQFPDEYQQASIELIIANNPVALVYFPDGKDPLDHPKALQPTTTSPPIDNTGYARPWTKPASHAGGVTHTVSVPFVKNGGAVKDGDGYICTKTGKGVVNIPEIIVNGVTPNGGTYDISVNGTIIYKTPDGNGRLRIASSKLGGGSRFRIEVINNTITVEQV